MTEANPRLRLAPLAMIMIPTSPYDMAPSASAHAHADVDTALATIRARLRTEAPALSDAQVAQLAEETFAEAARIVSQWLDP